MAAFPLPRGTWLVALCICVLLLPGRAAAFGAGNIPSIAQVEGHNWRHGDIEDLLATVAFIHGKKWTSMLIKRTYFGNWLRDYSQAVDVGSLKGVNAPTIRILVWVLSFMAFGYATEEFEVTEERLGCYRPEEHIDNPLGYADGLDARKFDPRLRGPVEPVETEIDMRTGMKNYISNETGKWATSAGYIRFSFARAIHFGRLYTCGEHGKGKDENLCEALRCLGQALHCLEDFGAHSNYCELALRELGYHNVFPHCGTQTEINIHGKRIYPIVTGTFGAVDFLHSVIGEANDHFTQSEVDEVDIALKNAEGARSGSVARGEGDRGFFDGSGSTDFISLLSKLPDMGNGFAAEARELKAASDAQERENQQNQQNSRSRAHAENTNLVPGMSPDFDPVKIARRIYPILMFRDKIVKAISRGIAKVPGLEKLLEHISETLTAFVLGLLAPFIRPIINSVTKVLKDGSSGVITASSKSQLEPWENDRCSDPTHSMLSKDHFTNVLNSCAGRVAGTILQYAVPRVLFAWENPNVPVDEVVNDVIRAFHHPALRHENIEIQRDMFNTVRKWAEEHPRRHELDHVLSSASVKKGKNHILSQSASKAGAGTHGGHSHGAFDSLSQLGHGKVSGSLWSQVKTRDLDSLSGNDGNQSANYVSETPAPPGSKMPTPPNTGHAASYMDQSNTFQTGPSPGGYHAAPPAEQYYQTYIPQQGYGGAPPGPPPGQWGQGQPVQGYGGGYAPQGAGQGQYPPYQGQQPPGPGWNQYPGQGQGRY
ncbi:hypothetical protein E4U19_005493 [Claviceps sp. Clav32 group G5]|nr:hypothetical protein E4U19_005493 [Claviceps sp. Clav32 group G5]